MNKIYRTVWNESTQSLVVVSELAKSAGKSSQNLVQSGVFKVALSALSVAIGLAVSGQAYAGPTIYLNDAKDGACTALYDQSWNTGMYALEGRTNTIDYRVTALTSGSTTNTNRTPAHFNLVNGYNPCLSTTTNAQKNDTQTNRTLFYGDFDSASVTNNGAKNLTLGGRLDVNSGIIAVGNRGVNGVQSGFQPNDNYKIYGTNTHYTSTNSIRMGTGITLSEDNNKAAAIAIGVDTKALEFGSVAIGWQAEAGGPRMLENIAIGSRAKATSNQSIGIGAYTEATGDQSTALGNNTKATGNSSVAIGGDDLNRVSQDAAGRWNQSNTAKAYKRLTGDELIPNENSPYISTQAADAAVALGVQAKAGGALSTAFGTRTEATGIASLALGVGAKVTRENAVAIGAGSLADNTVVGTAETTATIPTANGQPLTYTFSGGANTTENDIVSFGKTGFERQLKHVAAGKIADGSTDAVNGSQLYAVASKIQTQLGHYYSVKSTEQGTGSNYNNDGATGTNALAAGVKAIAVGESSVAVGNEAKTENQNSVAIGTKATTKAVDSVAIGLNAQVSTGHDGTAVAIGANSKAQNKSAVALGNQAEANGTESMALGSVAKATGASALAMGPNAKAEALSATAVGNTSKASGERATALGQAAQALSRDDTAIGAGATTLANRGWATAVGIGAKAHAVAALASGYLAEASGERSTALGAEARATGESAIAFGNQANATVSTATAIGKESKATHGGAVALGNKAESTNNQAVAIGEEAKASGQQGSALGYKSQASGTSSTALGLNSTASGDGSTAIGAYSKATKEQTIAIGQSSTAAGTFDVSIGYEANAVSTGTHTSKGNNIAIGQAALKDSVNSNNNTAIGTSAGYKLTGDHNVSIGTRANSNKTVTKSVAIGYEAEAFTNNSLALGNIAKASGAISNAIGMSAKAAGNYSNALGYATEALGVSSIAIGGAQNTTNNTQATKNFAIAIGYNSKATGEKAIAIGTGNQVSGSSSGALGDPSYISGSGTYTIGNDNGTATAPIAANNAGAFGNTNLMGAGAAGSRIIGNQNNVQQANTFVVGNNVTTSQANSIVLGADSTDRAATTETMGIIKGITYGNFAGQGAATNGVVSVGKAGAERQIINVAAGKVSDDSTDAINGSQLYVTNNVLTNSIKSLNTILGGNADVTPSGNQSGEFSMTNIGGTGKNTIHEAIQVANTGWELQKDNVKVGTDNIQSGDKVNFVGGVGVDIGANVTGDTSTLTFNVKSSALTTAGGVADVPAGTPADALATATSVKDAINATGFTFKATQGAGELGSNTDAFVKTGSTVTAVADKNIKLTQANGQLNIATKEDVEFTSVKTGDSTLNSNGLTITGGPSMTKANGIDAGNKQITNVQSGGTTTTNAANIGDVQTAAAAAKTEVKAGTNVSIDDSEVTADGHKVYKVNADGTKVEAVAGSPVTVTADAKDANNVTTYKVDLTQAAKDSLANVATNSGNITALQNQTFKLQANNDTASAVKASDTVKFIDGDNINITRVGNNITVATAKAVTFDKVTTGTGANQVVLGNNGVEVGGNVYVSNTGLNANNNVITNVAPGAINANSTDAINGSQLHDTNMAVQALQVGVAAAQVEVHAGNNVEVNLSQGSKGQNIYTVHAEKTTVSGSDTVNVTAGARSATGVTNYAIDLSQQAKANIADGVAAKNIVDTKGLTFTADSGTTDVKKLGDSVAVNGDNKNITTKATSDGVVVSLNNSISVASVSADGVNIKGNGPRLNQSGAQMANTPITGMASGLPIDPVTGKSMTTVQIEQGIIDGTVDPTVLQNAVNVGDLAAQAQNAAQVNNIIYGTDADGNPYVNGNGTMTSAGRAALRTYNVDGSGTYERNGIFSAIKNMNEQGIKFFHTNDGVVQSVKDGTSEEDSNAEAPYSTAIGYKAQVEKTAVGGLAIGAGARAVSAGSIALGAQSEAAGVNVAMGTHDNAYTYGGLNDDKVAGKPTEATSVLSVGKPGAERQVQNVAAGVISETSTDAVNGSQLYQTNRAVENNTRAINQLRGDVHKMDNRLRAGVAGAYAAASLGQVYVPGKTQLSLGSGHYRGESAVALGVSRISDNGKVQLRLIGSTNTRGDTGAGASVSYLW